MKASLMNCSLGLCALGLAILLLQGCNALADQTPGTGHAAVLMRIGQPLSTLAGDSLSMKVSVDGKSVLNHKSQLTGDFDADFSADFGSRVNIRVRVYNGTDTLLRADTTFTMPSKQDVQLSLSFHSSSSSVATSSSSMVSSSVASSSQASSVAVSSIATSSVASSNSVSSIAASSSLVSSSSHASSSIAPSSSLAGSSSSVHISSASTSVVCPTSLTDPRDNATYPVMQMGDQCWMAQNIAYSNGGTIGLCYNNSPANCTTYGRLYNFAQASTICPTGWHLPSEAEWVTFSASVNAALGLYSGTEGCYLKATVSPDPQGWNNAPYLLGNPFSFSALPAGGSYGGNFYDLGHMAHFWSSTAADAANSRTRDLYSNSTPLNPNQAINSFSNSVRCVRD